MAFARSAIVSIILVFAVVIGLVAAAVAIMFGRQEFMNKFPLLALRAFTCMIG